MCTSLPSNWGLADFGFSGVDKVSIIQVDSKWEIHPKVANTPLAWPKKAPKGRQVLYVPILNYWHDNQVVVRNELKHIVQDRTTMAGLLLNSLGKSLSNLVPLEAEVQASQELKLLADCLNILKQAAFFQELPKERVNFSFLTSEMHRQASMPTTMFTDLREEFQKQKPKDKSFKFANKDRENFKKFGSFGKFYGRDNYYGRGRSFYHGGSFQRGRGGFHGNGAFYGRGHFRGSFGGRGRGNNSSAMSFQNKQ